MLDIHCHILPGVDDGPSTLEEALAVARLASADGITHITATPHCHRFIRMLRADVLPHVRRFNEQLARSGIPLTVLPGAEIQAYDTALYRREYDAGLLCHLGDRPDFTLLEFNWSGKLYPTDAPELILWIRNRGTQPIVAHPERHGYFRDIPGRLRSLADAGAWLQITVDSLLGNHGNEARTAADQMLREYSNVVLATDTHNTNRCSGLSRGYAWVCEHLGPDRETELRNRSAAMLRQLTANE